MELWEVTTGRTGESYERAYVWADTAGKENAPDLVLGLFGRTHDRVKVNDLRKLFSDDAQPFVTGLSDSGFNDTGVANAQPSTSGMPSTA